MARRRPESASGTEDASVTNLEALIYGVADDQRHRIERFLIGAASTALVWALMFLLYSQGHMEGRALIRAGLAMLVLIVGFYLALRTGLNRFASDPSLTAPQIMSSLAVTIYAMFYTSSDARGVLSLVFVMSFFFGLFRLGTRQFAMIAVMTVAGYLVLVGMLVQYRRNAINLDLELMRCAATAAVLFWFSVVGGHVSRLRKRLALSRARLEKAVRRIKEQVETDDLTGVHSRRYLMEMLHREKANSVRTGASFCVCIGDIDRFKTINDTFGHQRGDEVLRRVAHAIRRGLRVTDYFGRYGGDELMLILTGSTLDGARTRAEQVRVQVESLNVSDIDPSLGATLSVGVSQYLPGEDVMETVRRADDALYRAKESGRNRVVVESSKRS